MKKGLLALLITLLVCAGFAPVFLTYIQPDSAGTVDLTITDGDQKGWSVYIASGDAVTPLEPTGGLYEVPEARRFTTAPVCWRRTWPMRFWS